MSATSVILTLQYHKKATGAWEPATPWKVTCTLKVTNPKQAIAIGLSKARKSGAKVPSKSKKG